MFLLEVSLGYQCDTLRYRFAWAFWCLSVSILPIYPNQHLRFACAWHFHSNARTSWFFFLKICISLIGPILLPKLILRSNTVHLQHWSVCPQGMLPHSSAISGRPCLKGFPDLQDFCVIFNFTQSNKFFICLFIRSHENCLSWLLTRKSPEVPLCRRSFAVYMPSILRRRCSCWEVSLHYRSTAWEICQLHQVETEWRSPTFWEQEQVKPHFVDFQGRSNLVLFRKHHRSRWLNWWDPASPLYRRIHWRWRACFHSLSSVLLSGYWCILSGLDTSVQDTHP